MRLRRARFSATRATRSGVRSMQVSSIPGSRSSSAPLLPPGAAQASSTRCPGARSIRPAASCAPASWTDTSPSCEPRQLGYRHRALQDEGRGHPGYFLGADAGCRQLGPVRGAAGAGQVHAQGQRRVGVVRIEHRQALLWPGAHDFLHQPRRVRGASGHGRIDLRQPHAALGDEAAQDGIDQAGGALGAEQARGIDRQVRGQFRGVARVFDLVRRRRQQRPHRVGHALRSLQQRLDGRRQAQVPAHGPECDRAHRGALAHVIGGRQRGIDGLARETRPHPRRAPRPPAQARRGPRESYPRRRPSSGRLWAKSRTLMARRPGRCTWVTASVPVPH